MSKLRPIAFVLPQFHPIPENDAWWGKGFTEWTNVTKAKPLFEGHYQPQLPTDLGFYDLRLPKARTDQANLAKDHGIHGFCYYHYWFNGKRLLHEPIDGMLQQKDLNMPFMFCWANENWTRRWDGLDNEILIKQEYSLEDDATHMRWLCEHVFSDERYIKVDGCPVFMVYRQDLFPDIRKTATLWRDIAINEYGFKGLYLCVTESFNKQTNPNLINFDASVEFAPHSVMQVIYEPVSNYKFLKKFRKNKKLNSNLRDFSKGVQLCIDKEIPDYKFYRCVTPSWDNTARKGNKAFVGIGSNPILYYKWLKSIVEKFKPFSREENFVFINAMNEWGEGNHLEPCIKYGSAFLEETKRVFDE